MRPTPEREKYDDVYVLMGGDRSYGFELDPVGRCKRNTDPWRWAELNLKFTYGYTVLSGLMI
jgi:hypothetical protein